MKDNISQDSKIFISHIVKSILCLIISLVLIFLLKNKKSISASISLIILNLSSIFFTIRIAYLLLKESFKELTTLF